MSKKKFVVQLSKQEQHTVQTYVQTGVHAARAITRARILLSAAEGQSDPAIAEGLKVCLATVFNTRRRYCLEGLEAVLTERPRPGQPRKLTGMGEARLTSMACSTPPDGRVRWTLDLFADRLIALRVVATISRSTIQRTLKKTT